MNNRNVIVKKVFVFSLAFLFAVGFSFGQAAKKVEKDLSAKKEAEEEDLSPTVQLVDLKYTLEGVRVCKHKAPS